MLNQVVASEMVCYLRYTQNAIVAQGIDREQVASMFEDHAAEELGHFQRVADRVNQLGGSPDMNPATMMERALTNYFAPDDETDLQGMLRENLIGERIVIEAYTEIIRWLGEADITSRRLIEQILKEEEDHATSSPTCSKAKRPSCACGLSRRCTVEVPFDQRYDLLGERGPFK